MSTILVNRGDLLLVLDPESAESSDQLQEARTRLLNAAASPATIEIYFDPAGKWGGQTGCWRAKMGHVKGVHAAGDSPARAVKDLMRTAKSFDMSSEADDYRIILLP